MSATLTLPEITVTMNVNEWQVVYSALQEAPMPLRLTQSVALKLQQQVQVGAEMTRIRPNGELRQSQVEERRDGS